MLECNEPHTPIIAVLGIYYYYYKNIFLSCWTGGCGVNVKNQNLILILLQ